MWTITLPGERQMASIRKEFLIEADAADVWAALRDYGAVHERVAPGFVVDARLDGADRVVTFFNGLVATELLVDMDDEARRLVYSARSDRLTHHNASAQVFDAGEGCTRFVWVTDLLPNELAEAIDGMMEQGAAVMKQTLERQVAPPYASPSIRALMDRKYVGRGPVRGRGQPTDDQPATGRRRLVRGGRRRL
jgi:hypothetical protein